MAGKGDNTHAHAPKPEDPVVLVHEHLRDITERVRIVWGQSDDKPQTVRAKRKLRDKAREFSELALATLVDACMNGDSTAARISAAKELLDRGFGKSVEHLEIDDKRDTEAARMVEELAALRKNPDTAAALLSLAEASAKLAQRPRD